MGPVKRMVVKLRKGLRLVKRGEIWYLEMCVRGQQSRRSLGTADYNEAMKLVAQYDAGATPPPVRKPASTPPAPIPTLGDMSDKYDDWYAKDRKDSGRRQAMAVVGAFVDFAGSERETRSISRDDVQRFMDKRGETRAPSTIASEFGRLRAFLRRIHRHDESWINLGVTRGIDLPRDESVTKEALSREVFAAALRVLRSHEWMGDYIAVLAEAGMRPAELLAVRGIDFKDGLLHIRPWGTWSPKSKWSNRKILLNPNAARILAARVEKMFDKTVPIFANKDGEMQRVDNTYQYLQKALKDPNTGEKPELLRGFTLYSCRHFFCSEHAAPGPEHMELEALGAYIGHSPSSTRTLMRYYVDREALRRGAPKSLLNLGGEAGKVHSMA